MSGLPHLGSTVRVALAAVAVAAVLGTVVVVTGTPTATPSGTSTGTLTGIPAVTPAVTPTGSSPGTPTQPGRASAISLFPDGEAVAPDVSRTAAVDVSGAWPLGACAPGAPDRGREDFVSGTERGLEYTRDLAMGWYADEASAVIAYDGVLARIEACAASSGATIESEASGLGTAGVLATVAQPSAGGVSDVSIYAITRVGGVVTLAMDQARFYDGTVPAPAEATITRGHAERLLTELCLVEPARC
ncbi:MAG: hypothetical protein WKH47_00015 [Actinomycetes bacterium]